MIIITYEVQKYRRKYQYNNFRLWYRSGDGIHLSSPGLLYLNINSVIYLLLFRSLVIAYFSGKP